ncbi:MAG: hypothetical protein ACJ8AW_09740 [Rhodopila sp.]
MAQEYAAGLLTLPPAKRRLERIRIRALSTVAHDLMLAAEWPRARASPPAQAVPARGDRGPPRQT